MPRTDDVSDRIEATFREREFSAGLSGLTIDGILAKESRLRRTQRRRRALLVVLLPTLVLGLGIGVLRISNAMDTRVASVADTQPADVAVVGAPVPVTAGPASSERLCEFPDQRVEGAVDSAWLVGDEGVASSDRLAFELQGVKGFLGTAPDFKSRTLYVVLGDPSDVVAGEAAVGRAAPSFRTVVVASCYPMAELDPLLKELSALVQGLNSEGANLSVGYEPRIGRIAVNLDPKTVDVRMVQGLLDKYGDLVQIVETSGIQRLPLGG